MSGLQYLFIASAFITTTMALVYPGFNDLDVATEFNVCEGYPNNFDPSDLTVKLGYYKEDYQVRGSYTLRKSYGYPLKVLVSLIRPGESTIEISRSNNYCGADMHKNGQELDLYDKILFAMVSQNNYHCPMDPGNYATYYNINDYTIHKLAQLIDQEASMRLQLGNSNDACIELKFKRKAGSRPEPKRKAGAPPPKPAQEEKTSGFQMIYKFLKGLLSSKK